MMNRYLSFLCISLSTGITIFVFNSPGSAYAIGDSTQGIRRCPNSAQASSTMTPSAVEKQDLSNGVNEWLLNERVIVVSQDIDDDLAETIIPQLLYLDRKAPGKDIYLYINSPGGDITSGMAIYDTMRSLKSDVVTVSMGQSSSMATILLAGGTKGKRFALPNSRIMIHQPSGGAGGKATDVEIEVKELLYAKKQLNDLLASFTGQPLKRIELDTERDLYMSAPEAKAYGIVDKVITQLPSNSRP